MYESQGLRPSLLIVDDDETFCEVLADALTDRGYDVVVAYNTESGISRAQEHEPEYAVIDLRIGQESGLNMVDTLHKLGWDGWARLWRDSTPGA